MQNEHRPAAPYVNYLASTSMHSDNDKGLSKLELGTLMILQGMVAGLREPTTIQVFHQMASEAAELAKLGLDAAKHGIL